MVKVNSIRVSDSLLQNLSTRNIQHLDMNYCPVITTDGRNDIMSGSFCDNQNIISISNLNENITSMEMKAGGYWGEGVFSNCSNLISAPDLSSLIYLTDAPGAFNNCSNLTNMPNLPSNITNVTVMFYNCSNLVNLTTIPNSITDMEQMFINCTSLVNAPVIPNSVISMSDTFFGCNNLENATSVSSFVTLLWRTFYDCYSLTNIFSEVPYTTINMQRCFSNCWNISSTPNMINATNLVDISGAYWNCVNLTTVSEIPLNVENIGYCFELCNNISSDIIIHSEKIYDANGSVYGNNINVYIPFNATSTITHTYWYCWIDENNIKYYIVPDIYSTNDATDLVYTENFEWASKYVYFNGESWRITDWSTGEDFSITYTPAENISTTKQPGESSLTYDSFMNAGYSTSEYVNGVILKDLSSL